MNLQDVFKLQNPERYWCELWSFDVGHTELYIQITKDREFNNPEKIFYLLFVATEYISGPTKWQGANLRYGTVEEYLEYWRVMHPDLASTQQQAQEVWGLLSDAEFYAHRLHIFETNTGMMTIYSAPPHALTYDEFHEFSNKH